VSENFHHLIASHNALDALRALIIELGFRGRLGSVGDEGGGGSAGAVLTLVRQQKKDSKVPSYEPLGEPPFAIPTNWTWVRWGELTLDTSSGWSPQCLNRSREGIEWGVLKVSAVSWFSFKAEENKALPPGVAPRSEFVVRDGDFLMSRANTADLVGRSVVV